MSTPSLPLMPYKFKFEAYTDCLESQNVMLDQIVNYSLHTILCHVFIAMQFFTFKTSLVKNSILLPKNLQKTFMLKQLTLTCKLAINFHNTAKYLTVLN